MCWQLQPALLLNGVSGAEWRIWRQRILKHCKTSYCKNLRLPVEPWSPFILLTNNFSSLDLPISFFVTSIFLFFEKGSLSNTSFQSVSRTPLLCCPLSNGWFCRTAYEILILEEGRRKEKKACVWRIYPEIRTMPCKIVTAVSVFIDCFFWIHFSDNCCPCEQEGMQHDIAVGHEVLGPGVGGEWRERKRVWWWGHLCGTHQSTSL